MVVEISLESDNKLINMTFLCYKSYAIIDRVSYEINKKNSLQLHFI